MITAGSLMVGTPLNLVQGLTAAAVIMLKIHLLRVSWIF